MLCSFYFFFFKQKTAYEIGLGIPAEPLFRSALRGQICHYEPQLRDENAHNDKSVHGVLNPTYQAGLRRDAVQPDIEAERKKRDEIEIGRASCRERVEVAVDARALERKTKSGAR